MSLQLEIVSNNQHELDEKFTAQIDELKEGSQLNTALIMFVVFS